MQSMVLVQGERVCTFPAVQQAPGQGHCTLEHSWGRPGIP